MKTNEKRNGTGGRHRFINGNKHTRQLKQTIPNLEAVKAKQKATWEAGDFGQIARSIEHVAAEFMARQSMLPGMRVLDAVACGTGNLAVIAARQGCEVSGIDIAGEFDRAGACSRGEGRTED